ncbi:T9SS type A sorting domain-containing protein [Roseivirga echinicomitans]
MKNSVNKKRLKVVAFIALIILIATSFNGTAQTLERNQSQSVSINTTEDGKIKLKVVMKEGNDTKTFEKTYDSYAEINGDPDLEKHGIDLSGWNFGGGSTGFGTSLGAFQMGPGTSSFFDFDMDKMREQMQRMMGGGFGANNNFFFNFDNSDPFFMDMDSLSKVLKGKFSNMDFGFDTDNFNAWDFGASQDDDGFNVIPRARVYVRPAKDKDKETVGADKMEPLEIKDISFYPNPSDGRFDLEIETIGDGPVQVKILSPIGKVLYDKTNDDGVFGNSFQIDISDEKEGVYILQVIQNNKTLTKRVVIE